MAGTNGRLYLSLVNKLNRYPIPTWQWGPPRNTGKLLLDIGCGWGRWMVSAARAGYRPLGIDVKLDALRAARRVCQAHGVSGWVVAADLKALPFKEASLDCVFSYSVLQHAHRVFAARCVETIARALKPGGHCIIEFPLKHGITNWRHFLDMRDETNHESWCVRYYSSRALRQTFRAWFESVRIEPDCFFGIGVQRDDLDLLPWRYKPLVIASEVLKGLCRVVSPLKHAADSVFVMAEKASRNIANDSSVTALSDREDESNLAILPLLRCPLSGARLVHDTVGHSLISREARLAYPIVDDIPVMIPNMAQTI